MMLLTYSIFFDIPQVELRDGLYESQLKALITIAEAWSQLNGTGPTDFVTSTGFQSALEIFTTDPTPCADTRLHFPVAVYVKVLGLEVYNFSAANGLNYSVGLIERSVRVQHGKSSRREGRS